MPRLPAELTDRIIAHAPDRAALLACALICHAWVPASRTAAFKKTISFVEMREETENIEELIRDLFESPHSSIRRFLVNLHTAASPFVVSMLLRLKVPLIDLTLLWDATRSSTPNATTKPGDIDKLITASKHSLRRLHVGVYFPSYDSDITGILLLASQCLSLENFGFDVFYKADDEDDDSEDSDDEDTARVHYHIMDPTLPEGIMPPATLTGIALWAPVDVLPLVREWLQRGEAKITRVTAKMMEGRLEDTRFWQEYLSNPDIVQRLTHLSVAEELLESDVHRVIGNWVNCRSFEKLRHFKFVSPDSPSGRDMIRVLETLPSGGTLDSIHIKFQYSSDKELRESAATMDQLLMEHAADGAAVSVIAQGRWSSHIVPYVLPVDPGRRIFIRCMEQRRFSFDLQVSQSNNYY